MHALDADPRFDGRICVSGQHRGMLDQVLKIGRVRLDHDLELMRPEQTLAALTAILLTGISSVFDE
ncbi:UDP-N-acetylglucosamine 2-epimerase [Tsuneonella litorea]|uniref:UDP-N-acetylglucosamine 2-epimerase n=1 Tax=Tsuneonella litorea TaxID=2976475 RepID=UPI0035CCF444